MEFSGNDRTSYEPASAGQANSASLIDRVTTFDGTLGTERDLRIEGKVTGKLTCDGILMVSEGAEVDAEVEAESIIVSGQLSGSIRCRGRLEIRATGIVRGDVRTGALVIVEGARYEGQIAMEATYQGDGEFSAAASSAEEAEDEDEPNGQEYSFLRRFAPADEEEDDDDEADDTSTT